MNVEVPWPECEGADGVVEIALDPVGTKGTYFILYLHHDRAAKLPRAEGDGLFEELSDWVPAGGAPTATAGVLALTSDDALALAATLGELDLAALDGRSRTT